MPICFLDLLSLEVVEHVMRAAGPVWVSRLQGTCRQARQLADCESGASVEFWRSTVKDAAEAAVPAAERGGVVGDLSHDQVEAIFAAPSDRLPAIKLLSAVVSEHRLRQAGNTVHTNWHMLFRSSVCAAAIASRAREQKLRAALAHRGLQLRSDSYLCKAFIAGTREPGLFAVVDTMEEMHWFHTETFYAAILREMKFQLYFEIRDMEADAREAGETSFDINGLWTIQSAEYQGDVQVTGSAGPVSSEEAKHAAVAARLATGLQPRLSPVTLPQLLAQAPASLRPKLQVLGASPPRTLYFDLTTTEQVRSLELFPSKLAGRSLLLLYSISRNSKTHRRFPYGYSCMCVPPVNCCWSAGPEGETAPRSRRASSSSARG